MPAIELTPAQRKEQRSAAHHLDPVVLIGGDGLTPAVVREVDLALNSHGLIKVRVFSDDRAAREAMMAKLSHDLNAAPIQHLGKLLILWRPPVPKEKAERDDRMPGPKVVKILKFSKSGNHRPQVKKIKVLGNQRIAAGGEVKRARKRVTSVKKTQQA
ncbi:YhbY family RNA-binding protein [Rhizobacter sp. LjRoot28]|jgi:putative YhbY family RNA-binding protein|uniref:YhbY family RNA-binding protein n=1 Tax=Rhizobacter sp. LjRoot28 TaxID=3342309 RepID=UPI003ECEDC31